MSVNANKEMLAGYADTDAGYPDVRSAERTFAIIFAREHILSTERNASARLPTNMAER